MIKKFLIFILASVTLSSCNCLKDNTGLPSSTIVKIYVDPFGMKWVSTPVGLSCYDGVNWKNYTTDELGSGAYIYDISYNQIGSDKLLWLGTENGLIELKINSNIIKTKTIFKTSNSDLIYNSVKAVCACECGYVVAGTKAGISFYNNNKWINHKADFSDINAIGCSSSGWVFAVINQDRVFLCLFENDNIQSNTTFFIPHPTAGNVENVYTVFIENDSCQWFGTNNGVAKHTGLDVTKNWTFYTTNEGLVDDNVMAITKDKSGKMWFGTTDGISSLDGSTFKNYSYSFELFKGTDGPVSNNITSIAADTDGSMWFGTSVGLSHFNNGRWTKHLKDVKTESSGDDDDWD